MVLDAKNSCRLSCIALLSTSCYSFHNNLPRIPSPGPGLRWRFPESVSSKLERPSTEPSRRPFRNLHPFETTNFAFGMATEQSSDADTTDHEDISVNGNGNDNFVQNKTNSIKIEEEVINEEAVITHIEQKRIRYTYDVSKHFFDEMETRSGKDYRWIKPLTKPVSHVMRYVDFFIDLIVRRVCFNSLGHLLNLFIPHFFLLFPMTGTTLRGEGRSIYRTGRTVSRI